MKFADREYTRAVARRFLEENLRNGITTSCVYCTVHAHSADILFEEAERLDYPPYRAEVHLLAGRLHMHTTHPVARLHIELALQTGLAARAGGFTWKESGIIGSMMNARGLMALIAIWT